MRAVLSILCACISLLLTGCATFGQLDAGLASLGGASKEEVFGVLGYPDGKMELDSETTVYVWGNKQSGSYIVPQLTNTYGTVGTVPFMAQTTTYAQQNYDYYCTIKYVFKNGRALSYEYQGNIDGCYPYIERVKHRAANKNTSANSEAKASERKINYASCVEEYAPKVVDVNQDLQQLTGIIEDYCKKKTSDFYPNLASYHAKKAIDAYMEKKKQRERN